MGEDPLSDAPASTSRRDAGEHARVGAFVSELGRAAGRIGSGVADCVRLRYIMRKPD